MTNQDIVRAKEVLEKDIKQLKLAMQNKYKPSFYNKNRFNSLTTALKIISAYERQEKELARLREALKWAIKAGDFENIAWNYTSLCVG